jgi:uncharacterized membrane protein YgcG
MDKLTRRTLLRTLAGGTVTTLGTVVLARAAMAETTQAMTDDSTLAGRDVQERAAHLAEDMVNDEVSSQGFRNVFRKGGFPGFRNGGFLNGGGFRNGGFRNGGGGFRNRVFRNF